MGSVRRAVLLLGGLATCAPGLARAQALSAHELHDRIVTVFAARATRALPPGDTLVSWYGQPILFHTVARRPTEVQTGLVRADSLLGTAQVEWQMGQVTHSAAKWTRGDSTETDVELTVQGDSVRITGTTTSSRAVPLTPWGVADFGMEDLLVPTLSALPRYPRVVQVEVYRPYATKWETLQVSRKAAGDGTLFELRDPEGRRDWWLVSRRGDLVQLRREGQEFERRPLEETSLTAEYLKLKRLVPQ